jgi:hypothetical protein
VGGLWDGTVRPSVERGVSVHVSDILAVAFLPVFGRAVNACRFRDEDSGRRDFVECN